MERSVGRIRIHSRVDVVEKVIVACDKVVELWEARSVASWVKHTKDYVSSMS